MFVDSSALRQQIVKLHFQLESPVACLTTKSLKLIFTRAQLGSVMFSVFFLPLRVLCLRGDCFLRFIYHGGTENTEKVH